LSWAHLQVDPDRLAPLFESLLHAAGLAESYSLLVLNPTRYLPSSMRYTAREFATASKMFCNGNSLAPAFTLCVHFHDSYGYRTGLSAEEMTRVRHQPHLQELVDQIESTDKVPLILLGLRLLQISLTWGCSLCDDFILELVQSQAGPRRSHSATRFGSRGLTI